MKKQRKVKVIGIKGGALSARSRVNRWNHSDAVSRILFQLIYFYFWRANVARSANQWAAYLECGIGCVVGVGQHFDWVRKHYTECVASAVWRKHSLIGATNLKTLNHQGNAVIIVITRLTEQFFPWPHYLPWPLTQIFLLMYVQCGWYTPLTLNIFTNVRIMQLIYRHKGKYPRKEVADSKAHLPI